MLHFNSFKHYLRFVFAKEFVYKETLEPFLCKHNRWAKIGDLLAKPTFQPGDFILKNIHNPLFITATVIASLALTTIVFYPGVIPGLFTLANSLKIVAYALTQSTILGVGIRTLGRLSNTELMNAWDKQLLIPVALGSVIVRG